MSVSYKHPTIAREGWIFISVSIVIAFLLLIAEKFLLSIPLILLSALLIFIYRDPERQIPPIPLGIVSPIDGRVKSIENKYCKIAEERMLCLSIRLNPLGVFSIRSPIEGKVAKQAFNGGPGRSYVNWVQTDERDNIIWELVPKIFGRPKCYVHAGERIGQGQRCGFSPFRAIVYVYVPLNSVTQVEVDSHVVAGQTILAKLIHQSGASIVSDEQ